MMWFRHVLPRPVFTATGEEGVVLVKTGRGSLCLNHIIIREKTIEVQGDSFNFPYSCQLRQNLMVFLRAKGFNSPGLYSNWVGRGRLGVVGLGDLPQSA